MRQVENSITLNVHIHIYHFIIMNQLLIREPSSHQYFLNYFRIILQGISVLQKSN